MAGGLEVEESRTMTREVSAYEPTAYHASEHDNRQIRAFRDDVLQHVEGGLPLVDVRSPGEYTGKLYHMEGYPQEGRDPRRPYQRRGERTLGQGRRPFKWDLQVGG